MAGFFVRFCTRLQSHPGDPRVEGTARSRHRSRVEFSQSTWRGRTCLAVALNNVVSPFPHSFTPAPLCVFTRMENLYPFAVLTNINCPVGDLLLITRFAAMWETTPYPLIYFPECRPLVQPSWKSKISATRGCRPVSSLMSLNLQAATQPPDLSQVRL